MLPLAIIYRKAPEGRRFQDLTRSSSTVSSPPGRLDCRRPSAAPSWRKRVWIMDLLAHGRKRSCFRSGEIEKCGVPDVARHSHLKDLDYSVVQQCMHCGLCLPTCPTYDATKLERNSPRGRIALMRAIADDELEATKAFADEMYFCLGCLACMTACPAGVNYAELFEHARAEAEASGVLKSPKRNLIRTLALKWLFLELRRLDVAGRAIRLYQQLGLQSLVRRSGVLKLLPRRLRELEAMTPDIQPKFSADLIAPVTPAIGRNDFASRCSPVARRT